MGLVPIRLAAAVIAAALLFSATTPGADGRKLFNSTFGPFNSTYFTTFQVVSPATISNNALQVTPDTANGNLVSLSNKSGRVLFKRRFKLWDGELGEIPKVSPPSAAVDSTKVASFNSSFDINIYRLSNDSAPGEGFAFVIAPDLELPPGSDGQYLGLSNATTDGNASNHFVAVELDTVKQSFDLNDNHIGLDINSVRSVKVANLTAVGIEIAPPGVKIYRIWIFYDGGARSLSVFMAERTQISISPPDEPVLTADLDLSAVVNQYSYFGFAASTGTNIELNCVLGWTLTVEILPEKNDGKVLKISLAAAIPAALLLAAALTAAVFFLRKRRAAAPDPNILESLKSLPGTPREFRFRDLKTATNNFDDRNRLGKGGFGVVYKGVVAKENLAVAVKRFSRQDLKGKDEFLAELAIINRLRHKHLVRLLGWCHKNGSLLLVYDYMPNGSLDKHIFGSPEKPPLPLSLRYKIITGVASALHYLHNEYDQTVVHRDLKASNIMLDSAFDARLGDFGLARAIDNENTSYAELDGVPGTMGYIAPECLHTGKASRESDVYGFGAVVLEVVCGQRPWTAVDGFNCLVDWVWSLRRDGRVLDAVDGRLAGDYVAGEAERLLLLGLACSHPNAGERPKAQAIVQILSGSVAPPVVPPFRPAFVWPSSSGPGTNFDVSRTTSSVGSDWTPNSLPIL